MSKHSPWNAGWGPVFFLSALLLLAFLLLADVSHHRLLHWLAGP